MRDRLKRLRRPALIPGVLLFLFKWIYQAINAASSLEWVIGRAKSTASAWQWLISPSGNTILMMLGFIWIIAVLIWPQRKGQSTDLRVQSPMPAPLTEEWVEQRLLALGFNSDEVHRDARQCTDHLRWHGVFSREMAERFFENQEVRHALEEIYRGPELGRTATPLDPYGYCAWGPILHEVTREERVLAEQYVRSRIAASPEAQGRRRVVSPHVIGRLALEGFEFYESRDALSQARPLSKQIDSASTLWALWNTGAQVRVQHEMLAKRHLRRLILPHPDHSSLDFMARAVKMGRNNIVSDILTVTVQAFDAGVDVRWHRELTGNTLLIGNPDSHDGWIHIELLQAAVPASQRPSFRVDRTQYPALFQALVNSFEEIWGRSFMFNVYRTADGQAWIWPKVFLLSDGERAALFQSYPGMNQWYVVDSGNPTPNA